MSAGRPLVYLFARAGMFRQTHTKQVGQTTGHDCGAKKIIKTLESLFRQSGIHVIE